MLHSVCLLCNKEFEPKRRGAIFCSQKCRRNEWAKRNRERDREQARRSMRKYNATEKGKQRAKQYHKKNKEKIQRWHNEWYKNNRERFYINLYAGRKLKTEIYKKFNSMCNICGSAERLEMHHIKYDNNIDSIILLCKKCHMKEHRIYD